MLGRVAEPPGLDASEGTDHDDHDDDISALPGPAVPAGSAANFPDMMGRADARRAVKFPDTATSDEDDDHRHAGIFRSMRQQGMSAVRATFRRRNTVAAGGGPHKSQLRFAVREQKPVSMKTLLRKRKANMLAKMDSQIQGMADFSSELATFLSNLEEKLEASEPVGQNGEDVV